MERLIFLRECEKVIQANSETFYKAFGFLPSPKKEAVHVIYAFCRLIDDSVDEPETSPFTLDELEQGFDRLDQAEGHFIWDALRWLFREFPQLDSGPFHRQMAGQRGDLTFESFETMGELEEYCYKVAGTVGEMLLPVLHDCPDARIAESGVYLGKAMQIANIVRDVGEDVRRGRRYIPSELMRKHNYSLEEFAAGKVNPAWVRLIEDLSERSRLWFRIGLRDIDTYPKSSAFCVSLAAKYYQAILDAVQAKGYDSFRHRAVVSNKTKIGIFLALKTDGVDASKSDESWDVS
ncbi:hypothetical protein SY83_14340 [Paenibacillus swuensis]|uniref:Uncharacterized protein n=1 Tax=Paenibacillus swuensis TaxID=1178515 RepID=A0A172TJM2_9BACL|nr:phytoene/squalene synthase family protein [Paenibacillus swuensis]ANE47251.1 hypothetical protein SY83_14340 [Paenibacillus swuensis]